MKAYLPDKALNNYTLKALATISYLSKVVNFIFP